MFFVWFWCYMYQIHFLRLDALVFSPQNPLFQVFFSGHCFQLLNSSRRPGVILFPDFGCFSFTLKHHCSVLLVLSSETDKHKNLKHSLEEKKTVKQPNTKSIFRLADLKYLFDLNNSLRFTWACLFPITSHMIVTKRLVLEDQAWKNFLTSKPICFDVEVCQYLEIQSLCSIT